jgi:hypothetical protein
MTTATKGRKTDLMEARSSRERFAAAAAAVSRVSNVPIPVVETV